jgi:AcrR family transcriptional regulator
VISLSNILNKIAETLKKSDKQTEKQRKIVEAAISAFAEKGYSNTSTAEIAKMAGVAEGTIFKHFGTKENLLLSIIIPFIKDFSPQMADEIFEEVMKDENLTFEKVLRNLLENRINFILDNREIFMVFIKEMVYKEELRNELLPHVINEVSKRLKRVIETFQKRGELIDKPVSEIAKFLGTSLAGFFISRFVVLNVPAVSEEEMEEFIQFILNGIGQSSSH